MSMMKQSPTPKIPTMPTGNEIAVYSNYLAAQKAVDALSDAGFEVQTVSIVGHDLHTVERVTGRLTYPRVSFAGFASGAWFGLFVGLLMSLFSSSGSDSAGGGQFGAVLPAMLIGGGFGLLFSVISYAFQRGRRDFTSQSQIVASRYVLVCDPTTAGKGRAILAEKGLAGDMVAPRQAPVVSRPVDTSVPPAFGVRSNPPQNSGLSDQQDQRQFAAPAAVAPPTTQRPLTYGEALDAQRKAHREAALSAQTPQRAALPDGVAPSTVAATSSAGSEPAVGRPIQEATSVAANANGQNNSSDANVSTPKPVSANDVPVVKTIAAPAVQVAASKGPSSSSGSTQSTSAGSSNSHASSTPNGQRVQEPTSGVSSASHAATATGEPGSEFAPPAEQSMTRRKLRNPDNPFSPPIDED